MSPTAYTRILAGTRAGTRLARPIAFISRAPADGLSSAESAFIRRADTPSPPGPEYAVAPIASVRVSPSQKHGHGPQQDQEIERKAGICGVPEIAFEAVAHQVDRER